MEKHHGSAAWNEFKSKIRIRVTNGLLQVTTNGEVLVELKRRDFKYLLVSGDNYGKSKGRWTIKARPITNTDLQSTTIESESFTNINFDSTTPSAPPSAPEKENLSYVSETEPVDSELPPAYNDINNVFS